MQRFLRLIGAVAFFSGCATVGAIEKIGTEKKVALISAIDPAMRGEKVGLTAFGNNVRTEQSPDFAVNSVVLNAVKTSLNREVKLVDGGEVGLIPSVDNDGRRHTGSLTKESTQKLTALGLEWRVDLIVLIQTARSRDWIGGTNQDVEGFGHYSRLKNAAYGVFGVQVFDCRAGQVAGHDQVKQAQMLPNVAWHDSWKEYDPGDQRAVIRGLEAVIKESVPELLSKVGLTDAKVASRSLGSVLLNPAGPRPQSFVPEGNELEIPAGVSREAARAAIVYGLNVRDWDLLTNTGDRMVGVHRDGKKEAMCTFTFTDHSIVLAPEGHEVQADGKRVPVEYYRRWHNNLKESIVKALMKAPVETKP
jgi:hypothetical protein